LVKLQSVDAVRDANLTILRERRQRGEAIHPFYWAAFIAAGDWRRAKVGGNGDDMTTSEIRSQPVPFPPTAAHIWLQVR
jgi:hypothetical protein